MRKVHSEKNPSEDGHSANHPTIIQVTKNDNIMTVSINNGKQLYFNATITVDYTDPDLYYFLI